MCESVRILSDEPLAGYTSFGIGGKAKRLIISADPDETAKVLESESPIVIGGGSNLLIGDGGVDAPLIRFCGGEPKLRPVGGDLYEVSGSVRMPALAKAAARLSLSGLEWAVGIPGTLGGALKMNAGAYGGNIGSCVRYADIFADGETKRTGAGELGLGYRCSRFDGTVLGAVLELKHCEREQIESLMRRLTVKRRETQPSGRSAGCVYKACGGVPAYRYILGAGLAGLKKGGAAVSEKHANFIVCDSGATAADVLFLMSEIERRVFESYGVELEREIKLLGRF